MTLTEYFKKTKHIVTCLSACWFDNALTYRTWRERHGTLRKDSIVFIFGHNIAAGYVDEDGHMGGIYNLGICTKEKIDKIKSIGAAINLGQGRHTVDFDKLKIIEQEGV